MNRRSDLERSLVPGRLALLRLVADQASSRGLPLYLVGGFVRDLLLDRPGTDFDLVVEGDAILFANSLADKHGGKVASHAHFGTAIWSLDGSKLAGSHAGFDEPAYVHNLDLISARSETYKHPAALPIVKRGTLTDDLLRRDFTINSLALRLDGKHFGELHDELGGLEDLKTGLIRVLHPASFIDDPTRLFRAVRYEQRYGFQIAPETLALIPAACPLIDKLSAERIRHELDLILEEKNAASMLKRLRELGILAAVHPALEWKADTKRRFVNGLASALTSEHFPSRRILGWSLWLMDSSLSGLQHIEKRLHFDSGLREILFSSSALFADAESLAGKRPSQCVAILDVIPLKAVQAVFLALPNGPGHNELRDYLENWRHIKAKTNGHDLIERGLPPGPAYQSILSRLRNAWLDGEIKTAAEERIMLENLVNLV